MGGLRESARHENEYWMPVTGSLGYAPLSRTCDDYAAAGERYRTLADWEREDLLKNVSGDLQKCPEHIAQRMVWHFYHCDENYGTEVAKRAGIDLQRSLALPPLRHHPGPGANRGVRGAANGSQTSKQTAGVTE